MTPRKDAQTWGAYAPIYELILSHCSPLHFPPPWDFLPARPDCRGPVADSTALLADLRAHFDEQTLRAAEVVSTSSERDLQLSPRFAGPDAALIALRDPRDGPLQGLLTAHGCLPAHPPAFIAVQKDHWTREALSKLGVLFATPDIHEVALLQALGLPATLSRGLDRLLLAGLEKVHVSFWEYQPRCPRTARPTLALVGWSPLSLGAQPSAALAPVITHLAQARYHLEMELPGVMAWQLSSDDLENLRFRLRLRDVPLIRRLLLGSLDNLDDFATLLPSGGIPTTAEAETGQAYVEAQSNLLTLLTDAPTGGLLAERARQASERYADLVRRKLIKPLQEWALESSDPILRNIGLQLSTVCQLLHQMSPLLLSQQVRQFDSALATASEPLPEKTLRQFLALTGRLSNLVRDLCQWRHS